MVLVLPGGCGGGTHSLSEVRQGPGLSGDSSPPPVSEFLRSSLPSPPPPRDEVPGPEHDGKEAAARPPVCSQAESQLLRVVPEPDTLSLGLPDACGSQIMRERVRKQAQKRKAPITTILDIHSYFSDTLYQIHSTEMEKVFEAAIGQHFMTTGQPYLRHIR